MCGTKTAEGKGSVKFIATLAAPDPEEQENIELMIQGLASPYHSDVEDWTSWPSESQAYVTPDGTASRVHVGRAPDRL